ncbi:hypothetical protein LINPERHAP1_LOCUS39388 [Linum perenne]
MKLLIRATNNSDTGSFPKAQIPINFNNYDSGEGIRSTENLHIRREIKGFVKFSRMVHQKIVGSKDSNKH